MGCCFLDFLVMCRWVRGGLGERIKNLGSLNLSRRWV